MRAEFRIEPADLAAVNTLRQETSHRTLVVARHRRNVSRDGRPSFSREQFWLALLGCLLSTQQRSGPTSSTVRFLNAQPCTLSLDACEQADDVEALARDRLSSFGGIRRSNTIARQIVANLAWLRQGGWAVVEALDAGLRQNPGKAAERDAANTIAQRLVGFGPKQSRNLLQMLGLTQYEIPVDSRVVRWLRQHTQFPMPLSPAGLGDVDYYEFVLDLIQELCDQADVLPCMLDAMIFVTGDEEEWDQQSRVW